MATSETGIRTLNKKLAQIDAKFTDQIDALAKQITQLSSSRTLSSGCVSTKNFAAYKSLIDDSISNIGRQLQIINSKIDELDPETTIIENRIIDAAFVEEVGNSINYLKSLVASLQAASCHDHIREDKLGSDMAGDGNDTITLANTSLTSNNILYVYWNGQLLKEGAGNDYVATHNASASTVQFLSPLPESDHALTFLYHIYLSKP